MKENPSTKSTSSGFSIIEILVVIAIIGLLMAVVLSALSNARAKAEDSRIKEQLASLRSSIENETNGFDYDAEFSLGTQTRNMLDIMIANAGHTSFENGTTYEYQADDTSYVIILPLKTDPSKYWCIDNSGTSREVSGLLVIGAPKHCDNATR